MTAIIEPLANSLASLEFVLAYLAFGFAAAGLANASRHRWEDLALTTHLNEQLHIKAKDQARQDFHHWFIWMIGVSVAAETLIVLSLCFDRSASRFLLCLSLAVVTFGSAFFIKAYLRER
uniref:Uncharacterized protein n=1 Tax=Candidatus Kentrum sp. TC TaxID=2126339 RepID=A0A450ZHG0_9GAMM|nr:MAG: hypothetical protein BECKTC1821F_GA0114240_100247 [Candidatus Kentron sp. TC]